MATVGKNLVSTPRWDADDRPFAWQQTGKYDAAGSPAVLVSAAAADPITAGAGYAAGSTTSSDGALYVPIGHLEPGEHYIWAWWNILATGTGLTIGLVPIVDNWAIYADRAFGAAGLDDPMKIRISTWPGAGFKAVSGVVNLPDVTGYSATNNGTGKVVTLPDSSLVEWALMVTGGKRSNHQIGGVRVDDLPVVVEGYVDGNMTSDDYTLSWAGEPFDSITLVDESSEIVVEPPMPWKNDDPAEYTLPDDPAAAWLVDGAPAESGTYTVEPAAETVTVTIDCEPTEGYLFDPPFEPVTFAWTFEPPADDGEADALKLMRRLLGVDADDDGDELAAAYHMVRLFVWEYTRGKGFDKAGRPTPGLMAVIVSGSARLATNPEQASMYALDGITIRPAVFNGYTLAEQGVLHRYRRRFA